MDTPYTIGGDVFQMPMIFFHIVLTYDLMSNLCLTICELLRNQQILSLPMMCSVFVHLQHSLQQEKNCCDAKYCFVTER